MSEKKEVDGGPNLHQRILSITAEAGVTKEGKAPHAVGGYAFHKIDDVEAALKPLFVKYGVAAIPTVSELTLTSEGKWNRATAMVSIMFFNADDPADEMSVISYGQGFDTLDKAVGKAISYACKNLYLSMFHLKGQPDNEAEPYSEGGTPATPPARKAPPKRKAAPKQEAPPAPPHEDEVVDDFAPPLISKQQRKELFKTATDCGWTPEELKPWLDEKGFSDTSLIAVDQYDNLLKEIMEAAGA